jgi:putative acetyltransferase
MQLRESNASDKPALHAVHYAAFDAAEREAVAKLAIELLDDPTAAPLLSLVAEHAQQIIGHVLFTTVAVEGSAQQGGYIMAPLAVLPDRQRSGIGKALISEGLALLKDRGASFVMVLGDPDYYRRAGFHRNHHIATPHEIPYPEAWLALELQPDILTNATGTLRCADALAAPEYW